MSSSWRTKVALTLGLMIPAWFFAAGVLVSGPAVAQDPEPSPAAAVEAADGEGVAPVVSPGVSEGEGEGEGEGEASPGGGGRAVDLRAGRDDIEVSLIDRLRSILGMGVLLGLCWVFSTNRKAVSWRLVAWGLGIQMALGLFVMRTETGKWLFGVANEVVSQLLGYTTEGAAFVFGNLARGNEVPVGVMNVKGVFEAGESVSSMGAFFAFGVLPTIIFFSSLMAVLYHMGVMQLVVSVVATVMQKTMGTSGAETLAASGNIFVGQTESPLLIRPFISKMTESELMAVMTCGFATVAGGVMAAYVGMLREDFPDIAGHLISASVMSAPAALVCAKILVPEPVPERSETYGELDLKLEKIDANVIDAAARGAGDGLTLALNVGAMLLAFVALVAMLNGLFGLAGNVLAWTFYGRSWDSQAASVVGRYVQAVADNDTSARDTAQERLLELGEQAARRHGLPSDLEWSFDPDLKEVVYDEANKTLAFGPAALNLSEPALIGLPPPEGPVMGSTERFLRNLSMEAILGLLLAPLAWVLGVAWSDAGQVGGLIGKKTIVNEFVAYLDLAEMLKSNTLTDPRSKVIATYALCGFANLGSIAIQIGGIGGIAPERRSDLARLGIKAMIAGNVGCLLTATVAGLLV